VSEIEFPEPRRPPLTVAELALLNGGPVDLEFERPTLRGGDWILDAPTEVPAVWGGASGTVAWAKGEPLMIVGPDGVGKTALLQQLALARIGLRRRLLGMRVEADDDKPVLYIAADRPNQAQRSFRRMVTPDDRRLLNERLIPWKGPLPFSLIDEPSLLAKWIAGIGAGTVFVDSLKDVALDLSKEETGTRVNAAIQQVIADDIELCAAHHQRKAQQGAVKPRTLADVYGSRWLTAGMGSVLLLWGEPGDLVVELSHLKQPADEIGPLQLLHDHTQGRTTVTEEVNLLDLAEASGFDGLLVNDAAKVIFGTEQPNRNQTEKARRKLENLVDQGLLERDDSRKPEPARYFLFGQRA